MLKKIALFSALAAIMGTTYAYKAEVGVSYDKNEIFDEIKDKSIQLDGKYFLKNVEAKNGPLNEAAFLERASNFNANINHTDYFSDFELTKYSLGLEYFAPTSNFYVNANIGKAELEVGSLKAKSNNYAVEVGYLPVNGLLIAAGLNGFNFNNYGSSYNDTNPTLRAKYVTKAGKYDVNLEADARFGDETVYGLAADVYLDKTLSLGVAYKSQKDDIMYGMLDEELDYISIRAKKFFTPQISVEANAKFGDEVDGFGLSAGYRF